MDITDNHFHLDPSGQKEKAIDGLVLLKQLNSISNDRIKIMPGSGINKSNIVNNNLPNNFDGQKRDKTEEKSGKKIFEKDLFRESPKKSTLNRGFDQKRQGKLTIARALDSDNIFIK